MLIPHALLSPDVLDALIEDFVTRDGTDNGDETPLATRVIRVKNALSRYQAVIVFDPETQQCSLARADEVPAEWVLELKSGADA